MPWKTVSLLKVRQRLVEAVLARRQTLQEICRRFGVSRKTAYKWRARFRRRGLPGLRDHSRRARRARRGPALPHPGLTVATRPNQVWTVDLKGWFRTSDGVRQEPLAVRDLFSRYGLCLRLLPHQDDRPARRAMQRLFRQRGLPERDGNPGQPGQSGVVAPLKAF